MLFEFYDTETTGFPHKNLPDDHPDQPHLMQIAGILADETGKELACLNFTIAPEPGQRPPSAEAVATHGITPEIASLIGIKERWAVATFMAQAAKADYVVAHNEQFDRRIVTIAQLRHQIPIALPEKAFCTCQAAAPIVNLPPTEKMLRAGFNKPKNPNLAEAYRHFFGQDFEGSAHDALTDVRACKAIFFKLLEIGAVKV